MSGPEAPTGRGASATLRPSLMGDRIRVARHHPGQLAPWVEYVWTVRWEVPEPHEQAVIPQPVAHAAAEEGRLLVHGVGHTSFQRRLVGTGHVVGAAFRAGGFRCFTTESMDRLARRVVPAAELLGVDDRPLARDLLHPSATDAALADRLLGWLAEREPRDDPVAVEIGRLVDLAEHDHSLTRAEQVADLAGVSLRTLQRQFGDYVGIGPKWVVRRFRLLDAAAAAHGGADVDWAALADALGFSDQAHLTRQFTAVAGTPPAAYRRDA